jgi:glycosyltransferase involved in cell wall biosynthesis
VTTRDFAVSICICTRNRPESLKVALRSVHESQVEAHQVVVADDSDGAQTQAMVQTEFRSVEYVSGPRRGLGANRNRALAQVTGSHVLFLDDDAELDTVFLDEIYRCFQKVPQADYLSTIFTGIEVQAGRAIYPNRQDALGFQSRPYLSGERLQTVVINATVFPASLFQHLQFDPQLAYGYDEVDLTTRAVGLGYSIVPCFQACNRHNPSEINREEYRRVVDASRLYVTFKRRRYTEGSFIRAWLGLAVGVGHNCMAAMKRRGPVGLGDARSSLRTARAYCRANLDRTA